MKTKTLLFLIITGILTGCNDIIQRIDITPNISIAIPQKSCMMAENSKDTQNKWEFSFEDDQLEILKYSIVKSPDYGPKNLLIQFPDSFFLLNCI